MNEITLFPGVGSHFDRHHTFVVRYKVGEDLGLDMHTDDSDVTFNVCLGKDFKGAGLQFCGDQGATDHRKASLQYQHRVGHCVVHRGHRRHGADDITEGERLNLIVWTRCSEKLADHFQTVPFLMHIASLRYFEIRLVTTGSWCHKCQEFD